MSCCSEVEIMLSEEDAQPEFVHLEAFGEGKGFAHEAADALASGAEETLGMAGLAVLLGTEAVSSRWKYRLIGKPLIAARGAAEVVGRQASSQPPGAFFRAVAQHAGNNLASAPAQGHPQPALALFFAANEAPELIELQHVASSGRQQRFVECGQFSRLFFPPSGATSGNRGRRCGGWHGCSGARKWQHAQSSGAPLRYSAAALAPKQMCSGTPSSGRVASPRHCGRSSSSARCRNFGSDARWSSSSSASQNLPLIPVRATRVLTSPVREMSARIVLSWSRRGPPAFIGGAEQASWRLL